MVFTGQGFGVGVIFVHYYGVVIMLGVIAGAWLATKQAQKRNVNPEMVWDMLIWLVIGSVIGARIWHILTPPPSSIEGGLTTIYYLTHPLDAIAIWNGGLGLVGGVVGGLIALYLYCKKHQQSLATWVDIVAPALALGQAIGRWGNFFNQELYGAPTDLPWKLFIDPQHRYPGFENVAYYHPLFLYESILSLANVIFLLWVYRRFQKVLKPGDLFLTYLITYPIIRFLLEFLRLDSSYVAGINANQDLMVFIIMGAALALFWRHRKKTSNHSTLDIPIMD
jgi:phosphatidylglycerol:prolipoprotein diacylglycerol transferase